MADYDSRYTTDRLLHRRYHILTMVLLEVYSTGIVVYSVMFLIEILLYML